MLGRRTLDLADTIIILSAKVSKNSYLGTINSPKYADIFPGACLKSFYNYTCVILFLLRRNKCINAPSTITTSSMDLRVSS